MLPNKRLAFCLASHTVGLAVEGLRVVGFTRRQLDSLDSFQARAAAALCKKGSAETPPATETLDKPING